MAAYDTETISFVHHWDERVFSFRTTRKSSLRFEAGQFVMIGLNVDGKPLMRAYSIASPPYADYLEFLSIKVENGPLTSRLQHIKIGDEILMSQKPVGTLVLRDLKPAKRLWMLATGTGLAPFMSLVLEPETYERFDQIILLHGVRKISELAYYDFLSTDIKNHEYLGEIISQKLIYHPLVTREEFKNQGRIPDGLDSGAITTALGIDPLNKDTDRAMICGSVDMLSDLCDLLDRHGFTASPKSGVAGDYVFERAFVPS
jgi:ferredoxin--NADP+ reductase